jgi:hypothetical protein
MARLKVLLTESTSSRVPLVGGIYTTGPEETPPIDVTAVGLVFEDLEPPFVALTLEIVAHRYNRWLLFNSAICLSHAHSITSVMIQP